MMTKTKVRLPDIFRPIHKHQMVRVGSIYDGGYIIAASLISQINDILTFGLGLNWDFERDMARLGHVKRIHCYDHTVEKKTLRKKYIKAKLLYNFKPAKYSTYIFAYQNYEEFFETNPDIKHFKLCVAKFDAAGQISVNSTLDQLSANNKQTFLKCDIEGAEYEISDAIVANAKEFAGIALEFHDVAVRLDEVISIVTALLKTHNLDHVHVNNMSRLDSNDIPSVIEISMSRHDLKPEISDEALRGFGFAYSNDPVELDQPNAPDRPDMTIEYFS
jgi:hypothetical protein